jgi:hypothetical protein
MTQSYEITFEWPNGDWTWTFSDEEDFHGAMLQALKLCPPSCRVAKVVAEPEGFRHGKKVA